MLIYATYCKCVTLIKNYSNISQHYVKNDVIVSLFYCVIERPTYYRSMNLSCDRLHAYLNENI